jgi:large-conductance mechanosensitive channel
MKMPFRSLWAEFKAFAFQGNMIELAVAVVIGAAFSNVIHAMVTDIINPSIGHVVAAARAAKDETTAVAAQVTAKVGLATTQPATQASTVPATQPAVATATPGVPPGSIALPTDPYIAALAQSIKDAIAAQAPPPAPAAPDTVKAVSFDWVVAGYPIGHFIGELINFVIIAFAIFILIVKLLGGMVKRVGGTPEPGEPTTKECPECLSIIPIKARRCSHCTAVLPEDPTVGATMPT